MDVYLRVLRYLKPFKGYVFVALVLSLLYSAANTYMLPAARDLTEALGQGDKGLFLNQVVNVFILFVVREISKQFQFYWMSKLSFKVQIELQQEIFSRYLVLSQDYFSKHKLGELMTRLFQDTEAVKRSILIIMWELVPQFITMISILVYLLYLDWVLTLFSFISMPLFVALISKLSDVLKRVTGREMKKMGDLNHIAQEVVSNVITVQSFTQERREKRRFLKENIRVMLITLKGIKAKAIVTPIYLPYL